MKARDIIELLQWRHLSDVFIDACKTDSTYGAANENGHHFFQMDAWVVRKSWVRWGTVDGVPYRGGATIGYEVKVSRSDFLSDKKWQYYLDYCHRFYFVCPHGLIQPQELPREAGLVWTTKNHKALRVVKGAPVRGIPFPEGPLLYALICRSVAPPLSRRWKNTVRSVDEWRFFAAKRRSLARAVRTALWNEEMANDVINDKRVKEIISEYEDRRYERRRKQQEVLNFA